MDERERREDWRNGVDKKLVDLTSAQRSTDDELDELDLKYDVLDKIMRGDPENDIIGFHERLHTVETGVRELLAEKVTSKLSDTAVQGVKWQSVTTIIVSIIGLLSFILPNIDKIRQAFRGDDAKYEPDDALRRAIELDKKRHHKKKMKIITAPLQEGTTGQP